MSNQPLRFVVEDLLVAVPAPDVQAVRNNLTQRGLVLRDTTSASTSAGVVLHAERVVEIERSLALARVVRLAKSHGTSSVSSEIEAMAFEEFRDSLAVAAPALLESISGRPRERTWLKVVRVDMTRTGYELAVRDEPDADRQLELLALIAPLERADITIKPQAGWQGYGNPTVFKAQPPS